MNVALHPINILSICTGGGGLDLGVGLAVHGARTVCMVEREAFAVSQLVSAMQQGLVDQAPVWSDARTFDGRAWRGCVDGLIGGIPCQPHSLAGKRLADEDERDLWSIARRIIVQSGAWFVLIENVRGMLSSGGAERVWRDLRRLGFEVEPGLFAAAEVGASHERERVFILAVADARDARFQGRKRRGASAERVGPAASGSASELRGALLADTGRDRQQRCAESNLCQIQPGQQASRRGNAERCNRAVGDTHAGASEVREGDVPVCDGRPEQPACDRAAGRGLGIFPPGPSDLSGWRDTLERAPELEPAFRRVADGLASRLDTARVDRLRMLGNGVVPLQAAYALRTLATRLADRGAAGADQLVRMMERAA